MNVLKDRVCAGENEDDVMQELEQLYRDCSFSVFNLEERLKQGGMIVPKKRKPRAKNPPAAAAAATRD